MSAFQPVTTQLSHDKGWAQVVVSPQASGTWCHPTDHKILVVNKDRTCLAWFSDADTFVKQLRKIAREAEPGFFGVDAGPLRQRFIALGLTDLLLLQ